MRIIRISLLLITAITLTLATAHATSTISVAQHDEHGAFLTDAGGISLYLFLTDQQGEPSSCTDTCAQSWPPLLATEEPTASEGADQSLLGTSVRADGTTQVTYNGWPVYYFLRDQEPGDALGQGLGNVWYLVSPTGHGIGAAQEEAAVPEDTLARGAEAFMQHCAGCHGADGEGVGDAPRFASNSSLANLDLVMGQVLRGGDYMPAFQNILDDAQIALIATYIRNSWDNAHGAVSADEVAAYR